MKYDLIERTIDFAVSIIQIADLLPKTKAGNHIASQIIRSGTSPAANYGEAQGAESRKDFIHKMKICLKELRETLVWLKILEKSDLIQTSELSTIKEENNQLILIFFKSIETAKNNEGSET